MSNIRYLDTDRYALNFMHKHIQLFNFGRRTDVLSHVITGILQQLYGTLIKLNASADKQSLAEYIASAIISIALDTIDTLMQYILP